MFPSSSVQSLEAKLALSLGKLQLQFPKILEHNAMLTEGGKLMFGPSALESQQGGVFIIDTGGGLPDGGVLMIVTQLEELLEVQAAGAELFRAFRV
jgi:hypothetical protein